MFYVMMIDGDFLQKPEGGGAIYKTFDNFDDAVDFSEKCDENIYTWVENDQGKTLERFA